MITSNKSSGTSVGFWFFVLSCADDCRRKTSNAFIETTRLQRRRAAESRGFAAIDCVYVYVSSLISRDIVCIGAGLYL